ncbi:hypothetical protein FVE85_2215 [Porphyridium purpureum]|uniref:Glycosyltransferase family 92 protein n=1 Tax=Porphyridium purpureum TaxID=35688 RepID=A0A5J4YYK6_PORPP|nr:hypothetical protein FVE85_2215 [Porphyridium purpureum]|eukprot:POR4041..scf209_3
MSAETSSHTNNRSSSRTQTHVLILVCVALLCLIAAASVSKLGVQLHLTGNTAAVVVPEVRGRADTPLDSVDPQLQVQGQPHESEREDDENKAEGSEPNGTEKRISDGRERSRRMAESLWYPSLQCSGDFVLDAHEADKVWSPSHMNLNPTEWTWLFQGQVIVRETAIDHRPAAQRFLTSDSHHRMLVLLSMSSNFSIEQDSAWARLPAVNASEYQPHRLEEVPRLRADAYPLTDRYRQLEKNPKVMDADWVLAIELDPGTNLSTHSRRMVEYGFAVHMRAPQDSEHQPIALTFSGRLALACASGWEEAYLLPHHIPHRSAQCSDSSGAVVIAGSALFGPKLRDAREAAHFIARSLHGPVRFDFVGVPVAMEYSMARIEHECHSVRCMIHKHLLNLQLLQKVERDVRTELRVLGLSPNLTHQVAFFPFCRLGSLVMSEAGSPCKVSYYRSQYVSLMLTYLLYAPRFRWLTVYDVDEFVAPLGSVHGSARAWRKQVSATSVFDQLGKSAVVIPWHNVLVRTAEDRRALSRQLIRSTIGQDGQTADYPRLYNRECAVSQSCTYMARRSNGKPAISCEKGMQISIHHAFTLSEHARSIVDVDTIRVLDESLNSSLLRIWHARSQIRPGFENCCLYVPDNLTCDADWWPHAHTRKPQVA